MVLMSLSYFFKVYGVVQALIWTLDAWAMIPAMPCRGTPRRANQPTGKKSLMT